MSVTVHHGDSRDVLKGIPEGSIDSVVCDPPYALVSIGKRFGADNAAPAKPGKSGAYARASAGFMGQKWDVGDTAFDPLFWAEVLRVLKPGGHLVAFGGTRTFHRLACAVEDAGFEIRDSLFYCYGSGFPKSHDVGKKLDAKIQRCSCDKDMRGLQEYVDPDHAVSSGEEQDLRPSVQCGPDLAGELGSDPQGANDLRDLRGARETAAAEQAGQAPVRRRLLQQVVLGEVAGGSPDGHRPSGLTGEDAGELREVCNAGAKEPGLERRGDAPAPSRKLRQRALRAVPAGDDLDGPEGRLCDGASARHGPMDRPAADPRGDGASSGSRAAQQSPVELGAMAGQPKPQARRAWPVCRGCGQPIIPDGLGTALKPALEPIVFARKPLATCGVDVLANVEFALRDQGVEGEIRWMSERASGAAKSSRRPGSSSTVAPPAAETSVGIAGASETANDAPLIEISSGSHGSDGTKQTLDDRANSPAEPTQNSGATCSQPTAAGALAAANPSLASSQSTTSMEAVRPTGKQHTERSTANFDAKDTRPGTESFAGIATGLSGSLAHVHINRSADGSFVWPKGLPKRLEPTPLTVAANVLEHGTGALNISGCRVEGPKTAAPVGVFRGSDVGATGLRGVRDGASDHLGRWPANVVHDGSEEVVAAFPQTETNAGIARSIHSAGMWGIETQPGRELSAGDAGSAARFFYSAKADAEDRLGSKHPTVKPIDLMAWLCRLVTPPGGVVLDPFAGTGTTGLAAMREGFDCILIEREAQYVADIERRLAWARGEGRLTAQETARAAPKTVDDLPLFGGEAA